MEWDRQKIKECLEVLKQLPDFDSLLFPDSWATEFNIPITPAKILDLNEYLKANKEVTKASTWSDKIEIRGPAPGGVREVMEDPDPLRLEITTRIVTDTDEQPLPELEQVHPATESTDSVPQENQASGPTGASQQIDAESHNGPSGPGPCA